MMCRVRRRRSIWEQQRHTEFSGDNINRTPGDKRKKLLQSNFHIYRLYLSSAKALLHSPLAHIGSQTRKGCGYRSRWVCRLEVVKVAECIYLQIGGLGTDSSKVLND